ncbi:MAG: FkbM family methyltransferase [Parvibaculales bacterium]
MDNPSSLKSKIKFFRPRRFVMGRLGRNFFINRLGRWMEKNVEAFHNEDRHMGRNGEYWLMQQVMTQASQDYVVFDVGANKGEWTLCACSLNERLEAHAFELVPDTYELLEKNCKHLKNVHINNKGLSAKSGTVDIFLNSSSETAGLYKRTGLQESQIVKGKVITGDSYLKTHKIKHINFLKIDVEGAEKLVLEGFKDSLKAGKIDIVYFEYGEFNISARSFLQDFYDMLPDYEIGKLMPRWVEFGPYDKKNENFKPAYYVAIKKNHTDLINKLSG